MTIKTRIKCIIANKFTLLGYFTPIATGVMIDSTEDLEIRIAEGILGTIVSLLALNATGGGSATHEAYEKTKNFISFYQGTIPEDFKRYQGRFYCEETGMYLAAKEMGVEDQLEPRNELCAFGRALMWFFKVNRHYDKPRREKMREQLKESGDLDLPTGIAQMVEDLQ